MGENSKSEKTYCYTFQTPLQAPIEKTIFILENIYTIVERTNDLIYKVRKKGGRVKVAHINRLKYYDPENSQTDKDTHLSHEEDLGTDNQTPQPAIEPQQANTPPQIQPVRRATRSDTNSLPPPIDRYNAATTNNENNRLRAVGSIEQISIDNAIFAQEFRALFGPT